MTKAIKKNKMILFIFLLSHVLISPSVASDLTRSFLDGVQDYNQGNFGIAIEKFNKIIDTGVKNSKLYYNLGNAYLKYNELGKSILWYERALKISADDPDLKFNYQYAISLVKDQKDEDEITFNRIIFFWKHFLNTSTIQIAAIVFNTILWVLATLLFLKKQNIIKFSVQAYLLPVLLLTMIFTFTVIYNYYESHYHKHAIIIPKKVQIRSGLSADTTELFILHAGTKVKVEEEDGDHYKIFFSEGKIGWVKKSDAVMI